MSATSFCAACYCAKIYCRSCKTSHCRCSWSLCQKKKPVPANQRGESDRLRNPVKSPGLKKQVGRERFVLQTREVEEAAYLGPNKWHLPRLRHSCWIDRQGRIVEVLCKRVSELSLTNHSVMDDFDEPTCTTCQRRKRKLEAAA